MACLPISPRSARTTSPPVPPAARPSTISASRHLFSKGPSSCSAFPTQCSQKTPPSRWPQLEESDTYAVALRELRLRLEGQGQLCKVAGKNFDFWVFVHQRGAMELGDGGNQRICERELV